MGGGGVVDLVGSKLIVVVPAGSATALYEVLAVVVTRAALDLY